MDGMTTAEDYRRQEAEAADRRHRAVLELYRSGVPQKEIARRFGVAHQRISAIIVRARRRGLLDDVKD